MEPWYFLPHGPASAALNMATDEALLLTAAHRGRPLLRLYRWDRPSVSVGYFQKFPAHLAATHAVVRRPTGGGLVYHGEDTTYTVVAPAAHPLHARAVGDAYRLLHGAVAAALRTDAGGRSAPPELAAADPSAIAATAAPTRSYECFQNPVAGDVVAAGCKLAGAAQRRTRWGMLHQGSIAAAVSADRLQAGFLEALGVRFEPYPMRPEERALADRLVREKYATDRWNRRVV